MSSERLWIAILAVVCLLAGVALGILVAPHLLVEPAPGPFAAYQDRLAREFDLSRNQKVALRSVMEEYERRLERIEAGFLRETADDRAKLGRQCKNTIVEHVLAEEDVSRFEAMARGSWPAEADSRESR